MAGKNLIGNLAVNLGLESAAFTDGLKQSQARVAKFGSALKSGLLAAAAAAAAAMAAMAVGIKAALDDMDAMSKTAQKIGVPIDELSKLAHAADLSGVSIEGLANGMKRISANMLDVAQGAVGPAAKAFEALGISVKDSSGKLRSSTDVVDDIADKFASFEDGAGKTALAMAIFGKSGADMIPLLNAGSDGIGKMKDEAEKLGIVISQETATAAENFNDNLTRLGKVGKGIFTQFAAQLAPTLSNLSDTLVDVATETSFFKDVTGLLAFAVKGLISAGLVLYQTLKNIVSGLSALGKAAYEVLTGNFSAAKNVFVEFDKEYQKSNAAMADAVRELWSKETKEVVSTVKESASKIPAPFLAAVEKIKDGTDKLSEDVADTMADFFKEIKAAHEEMIKVGQTVWEQTRTPLEQYNNELIRLNELLEYGAINHDTYGRAALQAQEKLTEALSKVDEQTKANQQAMESWQHSVSDGFADAILSGKKLGGVLKDLIMQLAKSELSNLLFGAISGKSGGGSILGGLFGGMFADGGSPPMGRVSLVGERGPELFVPKSPGTIIPNGEFGGGSVTINQTIAPNFAGNAATRQDVLQMAALARQSAIEGVRSGLARNRGFLSK